ncbi:hypothetical protein [Enterobacter hormaechei]|uniref:hypothetical protein n=1 Tax=Enterobacter hormaechei TaxID=158836 RepID=UPI0032DB8F0F
MNDVAPVTSQSGIGTDSTSYVVGEDIILTVTLNDQQGSPVTGQAAALAAEAVTVPNAVRKAGGGWTDNGDGTYTGSYTAQAAGEGLKAVLQLGGWGSGMSSGAYAITAGSEPPESIYTHINHYTFAADSEEGTFPTTGFTGATFTLIPRGGKITSDYSWTSDASWVSVSDVRSVLSKKRTFSTLPLRLFLRSSGSLCFK